jgi:hypothetical protein
VSTIRSRPSTSITGVRNVIMLLRIVWMNGVSSTISRYASSISISGPPDSGECMPLAAQ